MTTYKDYAKFVHQLTKDLGHDGNLNHAALGVASDGGEFVDAIKAHTIYGKSLDLVNLVEEAGDVMFFLQMALNQFGLTLQDAADVNRIKLGTRYHRGYNDADAIKRDKAAEREVMTKLVYDRVGNFPQ